MRAPDVADLAFTFYGGAREFARYHGPEALLHGPAETGKTYSALWKVHLCALKYPRASLVILRKTQASAYSTVLQTYQNKVLGGPEGASAAKITIYGGEKPEWFDYPSGARVWAAGLDKAGKVLSAEHDVIYVNQAEELTLEDWETLTTRTTGRAGNMPYSQTIGDCNPTYPQHWMYNRPSLRMFYSKHTENPALYDQVTGAITAQGQRTMAVLDALTGVRRDRLRDGKAAQAEGAVYDEWNEAEHLIHADKVPPLFRFVAAQDWGYTNPGVLGVFGVDNDGRMYLVAQIYRTHKGIDWWKAKALALQQEFGRFERVACDPAEPAFIAEYRAAGLNAVPADNAVRVGIDAVKRRLAKAGDGKPRLFVVRDSQREVDQELVAARLPHAVEHEFPAYVWESKGTKEQPVKENDHGMDMVRYAVMAPPEPRPARSFQG